MKLIRGRQFRAGRLWGADNIANMAGTTTRLHWTDQSYSWHVNDVEARILVVEREGSI